MYIKCQFFFLPVQICCVWCLTSQSDNEKILKPSGVLFKEIAKVKPSHATWQLIYNIQWTKLFQTNPPVSELIQNINTTFGNIEKTNISKTFQEFLHTYYTQLHMSMEEILQIKDNMILRYPDTLRQKRAIIPIGNMLHSLFGTASDAQIQEVKGHIQTISNTQKKIILQAHNRLVLINMTHAIANTNHENINKLHEAYKDLKEETFRYRSTLDTLSFHASYNRMHVRFQEICTSITLTLQHIANKFHQYKNALYILDQKRIPAKLITPRILADNLKGISQADTEFDLPFPVYDINKYYVHLKAKLIHTENWHSILIEIPLVQKGEMFFMYKVKTIPVPYLNTNKWQQITVPERYFLYSPRNNIYTYLTYNEASQCIWDKICICTIQHHIRKGRDEETSCITALHANHTDISTKCPAVIFEDSHKIHAIRINRGYWLVSTQMKTKFTKYCYNKTYDMTFPYLTVTRGVTQIPALPSCYWAAEQVMLYTGGALGRTGANVNVAPAQLHLMNPQFQAITVAGFRKNHKNLTLDKLNEGQGKWNLQFMENLLNQKHLEEQIQEYTKYGNWPTYMSFTAIPLCILIIALFTIGGVYLWYHTNKTKESNSQDGTEHKIEGSTNIITNQYISEAYPSHKIYPCLRDQAHEEGFGVVQENINTE